MGYLLPTVTLLEEKLRKRGELATSCQPLVNALLAGIDKRFSGVKSDKRMISAAILLPTFKTECAADMLLRNNYCTMMKERTYNYVFQLLAWPVV